MILDASYMTGLARQVDTSVKRPHAVLGAGFSGYVCRRKSTIQITLQKTEPSSPSIRFKESYKRLVSQSDLHRSIVGHICQPRALFIAEFAMLEDNIEFCQLSLRSQRLLTTIRWEAGCFSVTLCLQSVLIALMTVDHLDARCLVARAC